MVEASLTGFYLPMGMGNKKKHQFDALMYSSFLGEWGLIKSVQPFRKQATEPGFLEENPLFRPP